MNKKIIIALLFFSSMLVFQSCGDDAEEAETPFPVDSTLVAENYNNSELGLNLHPPRNWELTSSEFSEKIIARLSKTRTGYESFVYLPNVLFYDEDTKAVLNIGSFKTTTDKSNFSGGFEEYLNSIKTKYNSSEYTNKEILSNGLKINLLKINSNNLFTYQILFTNKSGNLIRVEYSCRSELEKKLMPIIESSIGTLRLIN